MHDLLAKCQTLSPETQQQVNDFLDFMLIKDKENKSFDMKVWKEKIKSVGVWSEEDVRVFEEK